MMPQITIFQKHNSFNAWYFKYLILWGTQGGFLSIFDLPKSRRNSKITLEYLLMSEDSATSWTVKRRGISTKWKSSLIKSLPFLQCFTNFKDQIWFACDSFFYFTVASHHIEGKFMMNRSTSSSLSSPVFSFLSILWASFAYLIE